MLTFQSDLPELPADHGSLDRAPRLGGIALKRHQRKLFLRVQGLADVSSLGHLFQWKELGLPAEVRHWI